ncbi:MAG: hypothetical protein ACOYOA_17145, partial [Saprospiraceae bacterium]
MKKLLLAKQFLSFSINCTIAIFILPMVVVAQTSTSFCGEYLRRNDTIPASVTGMTDMHYFYDRFGNRYSEEELGIDKDTSSSSMQLPPPGHCNDAGLLFNLEFTQGFTTEEIETITCTFRYISKFIVNRNGTVKPTIMIQKEDLDSSILATGSPIIEDNFRCEIGNNLVWRRLNSNFTDYSIYDGYIKVNSDIDDADWFHFDLNDPNQDPPNDQFDLFTVILHEALHVLGYASRMESSGSTNDKYSTWDQQLYSQAASKYLLTPSGIQNCCLNFIFDSQLKTTTNILGNCNDVRNVIGSNGTTYINASSGGSIANTLSHLCESNYVMYPGYGLGQHRKFLSDEELQILCQIGYQISNSNFSCSANSCIVQANPDKLYVPNSTDTQLAVLFSQLTANDLLYADNIVTITPKNGVTITNLTNIGFVL